MVAVGASEKTASDAIGPCGLRPMRREYMTVGGRPVLPPGPPRANWKISPPSTKKGRRSSKRVSKAVRLITAGSTSTWPKSGLTVASRVRFEPSRYLRSAPARPK